MIMGNSSSTDKAQGGNPKKPASKKLDFLLDTIDTEVANLADVVEVPGPILDDVTPDEGGAVSLNDQKAPLDGLELDMDLFGESDEPPAEKELGKKQAQTALDAMSDAEGEVEAMLAKEVETSDGGGDTPPTTSEEPVDQDITNALDELLATREVDASKLLKKAPIPKKPPAEKPPPVFEDQLAEDFFDDLDKGFEAEEVDPGKDEPDTGEQELAKDLLEELTEDFKSEPSDTSATESPPVKEELAADILDELEVQSEGAGKDTADTAPSSGGDEQLADLFSNKIEALVTRLIEERLSDIAERVVKEKINKIFSTMK
jgi:hypothetical protein